jgi:geranylgeranyl diphosphate synthase type I
VGGAILAGDLAFVWADQLLDDTALPTEAVERARRVFTQLRVEVMAGQYLDLRLAGLPEATDDDALRVALLKSGRYTVTRPLQMGAALAGGEGEEDVVEVNREAVLLEIARIGGELIKKIEVVEDDE